jgi:hypothetical protein
MLLTESVNDFPEDIAQAVIAISSKGNAIGGRKSGACY